VNRYNNYCIAGLTLLFFVTLCAGCRRTEPAILVFYCNETFWQVMQEETEAFQQIYGVYTELIPISPPKQTESVESESSSTEILGSHKVSVPWKNKPQTQSPLQTGNPVLDPDISSLITTLSSNGNGDIYLTDSPLEISQLGSLLLPAHEYPFCFLTMTMLVPKDNPMQIHSVRDVFEKKLRLGITNPSKDGLGIAALDIISKSPFGDSQQLLEELVHQFDYQYELLRALEDNEIDAALIWDATDIKVYLAARYSAEYYEKYKARFDKAKQKWNVNEITKLINEMFEELYEEKEFAERISLEKSLDKSSENGSNDEHRVILVSLISLNTTFHDAQVHRFADFLISKQGREIMRKHGFVPKN